MVFSYFIFGAMAMFAVSLDWSDKIRFIGNLSVVSGVIALSLWLVLKKHLILSQSNE